MTWLPLLATLLGAVIALGSTLLVERRRERREDRSEHRKAKRGVYARYLAAHAEMRTQLRVLSVTSGLTDEERGYRAFTAYAACYAPRYELAVLAPEPVLSLARAFDWCARDLRDRSCPMEWCIDGHSVISYLRLCGKFGRHDGLVGF
ncbi:hypothetical protein [Streptomyces ossamyceticus]|uniref:hypothetical protein n=1 Tax=Streptomyces ossamyceticus TaxID=249581 RepID=UPI003438E4F6